MTCYVLSRTAQRILILIPDPEIYGSQTQLASNILGPSAPYPSLLDRPAPSAILRPLATKWERPIFVFRICPSIVILAYNGVTHGNKEPWVPAALKLEVWGRIRSSSARTPQNVASWCSRIVLSGDIGSRFRLAVRFRLLSQIKRD